ncbi:VTT domain-containing protein [Luteolibacter marinus]|uniref:VTT domain-containing protein n=1 Tax=Luteolibacter marinus TaxID=2776705 RepID=UPI001867EFD9|nr:VTT domain-containing protein [Luteolibacter marinus]
MKFKLRRHRHILALGIIALLCLSVIGGWLSPDHPLVVWHQWVDRVLALVRGVPLIVFVFATALLPLVGMPVVPLYLMAGVVYSPVHGLPVTLLAILAGLTLNLLLSHWIARHIRPLTERLLKRFGVTLPSLQGLPLWKVVLLVRITPGAPLMIQNYLLALAGVPLGIYLAVSLPVELLICWGYMAAGKSFATGQWEWLVGGIGVVAFAVLAAGLVRDRLRAANR